MPAAIPYIAMAVAAAASAASADSSRSAQNKASDVAKANAKTAADQADQQMNATRNTSPDIGAMLSANEQTAKGGVSGTMLTGAGGVDPGSLKLGGSTLLGS